MFRGLERKKVFLFLQFLVDILPQDPWICMFLRIRIRLREAKILRIQILPESLTIWTGVATINRFIKLMSQTFQLKVLVWNWKIYTIRVKNLRNKERKNLSVGRVK